jgi:CheY-like chemotaxis protein
MEGYEVTVADHAARALQLAREHSFDVIFSDVVMPGKNGIVLLEEMRGQASPHLS